jgi:hypothetical protein
MVARGEREKSVAGSAGEPAARARCKETDSGAQNVSTVSRIHRAVGDETGIVVA